MRYSYLSSSSASAAMFPSLSPYTMSARGGCGGRGGPSEVKYDMACNKRSTCFAACQHRLVKRRDRRGISPKITFLHPFRTRRHLKANNELSNLSLFRLIPCHSLSLQAEEVRRSLNKVPCVNANDAWSFRITSPCLSLRGKLHN